MIKSTSVSHYFTVQFLGSTSVINPFPKLDRDADVHILDFLGTSTSCIVAVGLGDESDECLGWWFVAQVGDFGHGSALVGGFFSNW